MMWDWGHMTMGSSQVLIWLVLFALIAGGAVVAVLLLTRDDRARQEGSPDGRTVPMDTPAVSPATSAAEAELELRYARGEIDEGALTRGRAALRER